MSSETVKPKRKTTTRATGDSKAIQFRLEETYQRVLRPEAERQGLSVSQLARNVLVGALSKPDDDEIEALQEEIKQLALQIRDLRIDVRLSAEVLLCAAGKVSEKAAKDWAQQNLHEV